MGFLKKVLGWLWALIFGKPTAPPVKPTGKLVDHTEVVTDAEGKKWLWTYYTDGTSEKKPYDDNDPTGEAGFVDSLPK